MSELVKRLREESQKLLALSDQTKGNLYELAADEIECLEKANATQEKRIEELICEKAGLEREVWLAKEFADGYQMERDGVIKERDELKEHEQELTYYNGTLARESHNLQIENDELKARLAKHEGGEHEND